MSYLLDAWPTLAPDVRADVLAIVAPRVGRGNMVSSPMPDPDPFKEETPAERRRTNRRLAKLHKDRRQAVPNVTRAEVDRRTQERAERERSIASRLAARWFGAAAADNPKPPPLVVYHYACLLLTCPFASRGMYLLC